MSVRWTCIFKKIADELAGTLTNFSAENTDNYRGISLKACRNKINDILYKQEVYVNVHMRKLDYIRQFKINYLLHLKMSKI